MKFVIVIDPEPERLAAWIAACMRKDTINPGKLCLKDLLNDFHLH